jgi:transposase
MPTADEIERLVAEERWDEALAVLETSLQTALTPAEHSAAAVELALLYVKINNALTGKYLEKTAEIDELIKQIDAKEREIDNELAIAKIKDHINTLT